MAVKRCVFSQATHLLGSYGLRKHSLFQKIRDVANRQMDVASGKMSLRAEFVVICKFLKESGVADHFDRNVDGICVC